MSELRKFQYFVNNNWCDPISGKYFQSENPANGEDWAKIPDCTKADINNAVLAAKAAFYEGPWGSMHSSERGRILRRIGDVISKHADRLGAIETQDNGKLPKMITPGLKADQWQVDSWHYYAGMCDKFEGSLIPAEAPNIHNYLKWEPFGVVAQILPWNSPLGTLIWKLAPCLAAGNTVVLKPSEHSSCSTLELMDVLLEADLPEGVLNVVTGYGDTGAAIVSHPKVSKIAFTGSTAVGKLIQKTIAGSDKKATLELGGKSANIIFDDAPIDQAVEGIINGIFFNQGHVCCAGSRLFVQENVADKVIRKLKHRMQSLVIGNPLDKNTDIGAINSKEQLEIINKYISIGKKEGSEFFQTDCTLPSKGYYCRPTLFINVAQSSVLAQEEIFGPVLTIQTFRTVDEVIQKANNSPYGLAAGVWTDKGSKIFNLTTKLKAGVVWANTYNKFDPSSPFGGYKESGFGREGGLHGLGAYLK